MICLIRFFFSAVKFKKNVTSMISTPEPAICSCDACQWIPYFDSCHFIIRWHWSMKVNKGLPPRLHSSRQGGTPRLTLILHAALTLMMMMMKKGTDGFYKYGSPHGGRRGRQSSAINCLILLPDLRL